MKLDDARRLIGSSATAERAAALLRSRKRRDDRAAARKERVSVAQYKRDQFKAAVEKSFQMVQASIVPRVAKLRVKE